MGGVIQALLHSNQFASGGLLVLLAGGTMAALRKIPEKLWDFTLKQCTMTVSIVDTTNLFQCFKVWFQEQEHATRIRRVDAFISRSKTNIAPAPGFHWFLYKGLPIFVTFSRSDENKDNWMAKRAESFNIRLWGRNQNRLREFLAEVRETYDALTKEEPKLFFFEEGWACALDYSPRPLDSVILPDFEKEKITADIAHFRDSEVRYKTSGIPYHRGYLLYGLPGTGKTSLVAGLSSHFKASIYLLSMTRMTDQGLMEAVTSVPKNSMLILEDIDCLMPDSRAVKEEKGKEKHLGVTLSGLLNALDGLQTPPGLMFFMTTNYIEKLDPALIRPGRIDFRMEFGHATGTQKLTMYKKFFPNQTVADALSFLSPHQQKETMAEFQSKLLLAAKRGYQTSN